MAAQSRLISTDKAARTARRQTAGADSKVAAAGAIKPVLTAGAVPVKREMAKKKRSQVTVQTKAKRSAKKAEVRPSVAAEPNGAQSQGPSNTPAPAASQLALRPYSYADDAFITQVTGQEMAPIFKECYGYELDMNMVFPYLQAANTRIIMVDGQPAGYLSLVADDMGKMNIGSLVLAAPHQGRGYGKRIMRLVEQEARAMNMQEMEVFIQSNNARSISFAKSLGFTEVESTQPQTVVMVKTLRAQSATPDLQPR